MELKKLIKSGFSWLVLTRDMTDGEFAEAIQFEGEDTIITPDAQIAIRGNESWVRSWTRIETMGETANKKSIRLTKEVKKAAILQDRTRYGS